MEEQDTKKKKKKENYVQCPPRYANYEQDTK